MSYRVLLHAAVVIIEEHGSGFGNNIAHSVFENRTFDALHIRDKCKTIQYDSRETSDCSSWIYSSVLLPVFPRGVSGQK